MFQSIGKNDVRYHINKEKHTIVAYVEDTSRMFLDFCEENHAPETARALWEHDVLHMPNHFHAKTVCSAEDEWDEELGKRIAFDRLKDKIENSFFARAQTYIDIMCANMDNFVERLNKYGDNLTHCSNYRKNKIAEDLASK